MNHHAHDRSPAPQRIRISLDFLSHPSLARTVPCLVSFSYFTCAIILTGLSNALANSRRPIDSRILRDLAFEWLPQIKNNTLPNLLTYSLIAFTTCVIFVHSRRLTLVRRLLFVWGTLLLIRCTTVPVTNLPDPNHKCISNLLVNDMYSFASGVTCGDMIFSGHTVALLVCTLTIQRAVRPIWLHRITWAFAIVGMTCLLVTRFHYTVDVVLGFYFTAGFWIIYHHVLCSESMIASVRLLAWFEQDRHYVSPLFDVHKLDFLKIDKVSNP